MPKFNSIWDITPETAHTNARRLPAESIIWNYGDEDSPLGNDIGSDTFAAYVAFRGIQPVGGVGDFVQRQLVSLGVPDMDWDVLDVARLEEALKADDGFAVLSRDDFIIGLAFVQLLAEGTVDEDIRRKAIVALSRQGTATVLSFRGGGGDDARKNQLTEFQRVLELA